MCGSNRIEKEILKVSDMYKIFVHLLLPVHRHGSLRFVNNKKEKKKLQPEGCKRKAWWSGEKQHT